jgi:tripartite-type tricarboxylate transporter receptor subunit TctC
MPRRILLMAAVLLAPIVAAPGEAGAQAWPTRTVTIVVPYPPGGGVDALARIVAEKLSAGLGQQVIVDNRAGGSGLVGTRAVARAAPDGYTLMLGHTGTMAINPTLYSTPGYDPRKDFTGIGLVASMPVALIAHPTFPAKTVKEVIDMAHKAPGKLNVGTSAVGTGSYLSAELFKATVGIDATLIPYRGTGPLMNDLLGGHVPIAFGVLPPALGNIHAGTLRAIAVTGLARFSGLPDVPTVAESGVPGFDAVLRYGLVAPAGTPQPIVERINKELRAVVNTEEVKKRINAEGGDPVTSTPDEYTADIDREEKKWGTLVRKLNLKVE